MNRKPKILIILHQETSTPGRVGMRLVERGFDLDIRRPPLGDHLPETMDDHAGAVMFGGPMSANDGDEFIKRETDWLAVPLRENRPFLGICLGAQKLVRHLGGRVTPHPKELVEVGYYPLYPTEAGAGLLDWPPMIYQWHREGFDLPAGADLLAWGDTYENQAFRYGERTYAFQFHTELTYAMICKWSVKGAKRMASPGAQSRKHHLEGRLLYDGAISFFLDQFLDLWIGTADALAEDRPASQLVQSMDARQNKLRKTG
ncbi:MAG: glutamine amidotransferase [Pseudomonadota bacterium]